MKVLSTSLLLFMSLLAQAQEAPMPVVETVFVIQSPEFLEKLAELPGSPREEIERDVSQLMSSEAARRYPFLDWRPRGSGAVAARLILALTETREAAGSSQGLAYSFVLGPDSNPVPLDIGAEPPLFRWFDHKPLRNPDELEEKLNEKVMRHFASNQFLSPLYESFLTRVPLTTSTPSIAVQEQKVIVPLPWNRLQVQADSVLRIAFRARRAADGDPDPGFIEMTFLDERLREPLKGCVEGAVLKFDYPNLSASGWTPHISNLLTSALLQELSVHMLTYKRRIAPDAEGSLVIRP